MSYIPVLGIDPTEVHDTAEFLLGQHGAVVGSPSKVYKYCLLYTSPSPRDAS